MSTYIRVFTNVKKKTRNFPNSEMLFAYVLYYVWYMAADCKNTTYLTILFAHVIVSKFLIYFCNDILIFFKYAYTFYTCTLVREY